MDEQWDRDRSTTALHETSTRERRKQAGAEYMKKISYAGGVSQGGQDGTRTKVPLPRWSMHIIHALVNHVVHSSRTFLAIAGNATSRLDESEPGKRHFEQPNSTQKNPLLELECTKLDKECPKCDETQIAHSSSHVQHFSVCDRQKFRLGLVGLRKASLRGLTAPATPYQMFVCSLGYGL